ncbi:Probable multidrug resistance ABC transporter ATP-binding/permease protein YheI [Raoultella terrigena]|uniref:Probable multidrug resistance ABC transporter ATP-binding/permease protein YheI n=1 Tax=Raoultella terrigena TaxID=577 RepID=A0A4U9D7L2_RAOTE|nr:Probable multidrug resistance ABC transporter ATP-binding/permease protein YheI [Raoultella terrigena]
MRLFAQLSWYFRREWRRYLGAIALLAIIAVLQLIPPKVVGIVVDGVTKEHYTAEKVWMWIGVLVLIAIMVYLLRYVWRVLLFGASYQLAVELRGRFLSPAEPPASGLLPAPPHRRPDRPRHQRR